MGTEFYLFIIVCGVAFCYFLTKIIDWLLKMKKERYKDSESEFMSDLYRVQMKWARRGEIPFSMSIGMIISSYNVIPDEEPETQDGKDKLAELARIKKLEKEEY